MSAERYDIDAKPPVSSKSSQSNPPYPKAPPNDEQRQMLQSLLRTRFQLKYDRQTKDAPVYSLVRGKGELQLMEPKDKAEFPWSGSLRGGRINGDGILGVNESMGDFA